MYEGGNGQKSRLGGVVDLDIIKHLGRGVK
jgi:hypothetical protein